MMNDLIIGGVYDLNRTGQKVVATVLPVSKSRSAFGYLSREGRELKCYEIIEGGVSSLSMAIETREVREFPLDESRRDIVNKILEKAGIWNGKRKP